MLTGAARQSDEWKQIKKKRFEWSQTTGRRRPGSISRNFSNNISRANQLVDDDIIHYMDQLEPQFADFSY